MDGLLQSAIYTVISTFFYAIIIYGNILFLYPRLYEKKQVALYVLLTLLFLVVIGISRTFLTAYIYNTYFNLQMPEKVNFKRTLYVTVTGLVVYILSFVFRIALAYFKLKQQAEQMQEQKSLAELNLLKSQVQPHFLFNTLNNIYYEAFRESPRTATLIGRLSDIMRYFVDESPREKVALATEIQFLENYIALEKIRIRHEVPVNFIQECSRERSIPPMLLMTFVENIFKHGIDRTEGGDKKITISLREQDGYLIFRTENPLAIVLTPTGKEGFGIRNLQKRLTLLFGNDYELKVGPREHSFNAHLKIPLK